MATAPIQIDFGHLTSARSHTADVYDVCCKNGVHRVLTACHLRRGPRSTDACTLSCPPGTARTRNTIMGLGFDLTRTAAPTQTRMTPSTLISTATVPLIAITHTVTAVIHAVIAVIHTVYCDYSYCYRRSSYRYRRYSYAYRRYS
jgi:hypothetical protein